MSHSRALPLLGAFMALLCLLSFTSLSLASPTASAKGKYGWNLHFKANQGPPEEFKSHVLPKPSDSASDSDASAIQFNLNPSDSAQHLYAAEQKFQVDAGHIEHATFRLSFLTTIPHQKLRLLMKMPQDQEFKPITQTPVESWMGMSASSKIPTVTYEWDHPQNGEWVLRVETDGEPEQVAHRDIPNKSIPHITLLLENDSPYKVMSHVKSYTLKQGQPLGLVARLYDERSYFQKLKTLKHIDETNTPLDEQYIKAFAPLPNGESLPLPDALIPHDMNSEFDFEMDITFPDGKEQRVKMQDEEMLASGDKAAKPTGVYTATVNADQPGKYFAQVQVVARSPSGQLLTRTTQHMFTVVPEDEDLTFVEAGAYAEYDPSDKMLSMNIPLQAKVVRNILGQQLKAYAEVWGEGASKPDSTPVAFASGMTIARNPSQEIANTLSDSDDVIIVTLKVHANWLQRANVNHQSGKFELRNLYVQDLDNSIPLATADKIPMEIHQKHRAQMGALFAENSKNGLLLSTADVSSLPEEMKKGPRPARYSKSHRHLFAAKTENSGHKVVLSHGYCAAGAPFSLDKFQNYALFDDPNQNRSNDEFAQLLGAFGEQYDSFSLVAHSQGGIASLHLLAFYWSALDLNEEHGDQHRWIQTMGTPFQGTTLAGWGNIGKVVGVGCGSNDNLTPEGAKLWLTGIPMEARQHVYYYATQYKSWSWCSLPANAVLKWPNDGTTELARAPLDGGNEVLFKKGFCHTAGMKYGAQCEDDVNNEFMNKKTARV